MYKFILLVLSLTFTAIAHAGVWEYVHNLDPITDANRSLVGIVDEGSDTILAVRCMDDGLNVQITGETYIGTGGVAGVWRVDSGNAVPLVLINSIDGKSVYFPMEDVPEVVSKMRKGNTLAVRVYVDGGGHITSVYTLIGFDRQYRKLQCGVGI
jgi:hypothetical protein